VGKWNKERDAECYKVTFRENSNRYYWRARNNVIKALGNKCAKCGYSDARALQVDHVNGGGVRERKLNGWAPTKFYNDIAENPDPTKWQLLCANCNWIKRHENQEMYPERGTDSISSISQAAWGRPTPNPDYAKL
jgi:hypothetical protein